MKNQYDAASIEVLTGLEPVKKRPGMYTDTTRPNHLAQEVIDNSVDEAIAGYATQIGVILHADQSLSVIDNGRGMPVDIHPQQKIPGVEVILTKLHAGGKFSNKNYQFSGGLHGVGVSVVNALSRQLDVRVRRDGKEYTISFSDGYKKEKLTTTGDIKAQDFEMAIREFTEHLVLCPNCRLPETQIKAKLSSLYMACNCCSFSDKIKPKDKIILKCIDKLLQKK